MPENPSSSRAPLQVPLPDHVTLSFDGPNLGLDIRWFRPIHLVMLCFAIFWDAFLVFWYTNALKHPSPGNMALWFPLLHVGAGVGISYWAIAGLVNHTRVTVGNGAVEVRIGPMPWLGSKRVEARDITQVFSEEVRTNTRSGTSSSFHVSAITPGNRKLRLVSGLAGADVALYLEQEIEKALGITDRKVPGELQK